MLPIEDRPVRRWRLGRGRAALSRPKLSPPPIAGCFRPALKTVPPKTTAMLLVHSTPGREAQAHSSDKQADGSNCSTKGWGHLARRWGGLWATRPWLVVPPVQSLSSNPRAARLPRSQPYRAATTSLVCSDFSVAAARGMAGGTVGSGTNGRKEATAPGAGSAANAPASNAAPGLWFSVCLLEVVCRSP
jgi:hypothetical protein